MTGVVLAATLFVGFGSLSLLFTDDPAVLDVAQSGVWVLIILRHRHLVSQVVCTVVLFVNVVNVGLLQFVAISQPVNAIAFVADGLYYGVSDFAYAAYSTVLIYTPTLSHYFFLSLTLQRYHVISYHLAQLCHANHIDIWLFQFFAGAVSSAFLLIAAPKFGLGGIWAGLTLFMSLRAIAGFWR